MLSNLVERRSPSRRADDASAQRERIARALRQRIAGEVRFDGGSRALYATDASNYRQTPIGVVIPRTINDVIATVAVCREHDVPVLPRGGGTSLCGQCCNVAVILDFSKYLTCFEIDVAARTARVEPGVVLDHLRKAARQHNLTFAPDPSTHNHNTLGGMIGNNSCGPHSVLGGTTADNVESLDILLYNGTRLTVRRTTDDDYARLSELGGPIARIHRALRELRDRYADAIRARFPDIPRRVSGYNLPALLPENGFDVARALVGAEGTCATVLGATVRLIPYPRHQVVLVLGYRDVFDAADHVCDVMETGPIALEGLDQRLIDDMRASHIHEDDIGMLPEGGGWLVAEYGGDTPEQAAQRARDAIDRFASRKPAPTTKLYCAEADQQRVWKVRESGLGATAHIAGKPLTWEGWEDSAVPPQRLGEYLRKLRALLDRYGYFGDLYGHFGQGCVHTRIDFGLRSEDGIEKYRRFAHEAAHLCVELGGSISGEHGDGQSKAELLPIMFGDELMQAFREFKAIFDPGNRMNPGKVIRSASMAENLRLGPGFAPPQTETAFAYPRDDGNFTRAMLRCVGIGECRKTDSGTMCPSYRATGEEMHSTRGRARLLFEMLEGRTLRDGWRDESVKEALDLCLSCKACRHECPVKVDMATYKAEFLSHYYEGRMRPAAAYAFGLIDRWARLGSHAPQLVNFLTQHQPFAGLAKRAVGIAPQRRITALAREPFTRWFARRQPRTSGRRVLLWPDTFTNYFEPHIAQAAVEVLEAAGCHVVIPPRHLCCGRALHEFGMVDRARGYLRDVLDTLAGELTLGTPVVGLEPACISSFRCELPELLPHDQRAQALRKQSMMLSELLEQQFDGAALPRLDRKALVHAHCHHKSVLGVGPMQSVLRRFGIDAELLDDGCCGMAGSFGFEEKKYDVSMRCAEMTLLPRVRAVSDEVLLIANGFSCREQVDQALGRRPRHLAEVLRQGCERWNVHRPPG